MKKSRTETMRFPGQHFLITVRVIGVNLSQGNAQFGFDIRISGEFELAGFYCMSNHKRPDLVCLVVNLTELKLGNLSKDRFGTTATSITERTCRKGRRRCQQIKTQ